VTLDQSAINNHAVENAPGRSSTHMHGNQRNNLVQHVSSQVEVAKPYFVKDQQKREQKVRDLEERVKIREEALMRLRMHRNGE